jgi:hypothetical protein
MYVDMEEFRRLVTSVKHLDSPIDESSDPLSNVNLSGVVTACFVKSRCGKLREKNMDSERGRLRTSHDLK